MVVYRAGLENDDDMWGINPLTRLASHCSLCVASNGKAGGVKANIYFGDRRNSNSRKIFNDDEKPELGS